MSSVRSFAQRSFQAQVNAGVLSGRILRAQEHSAHWDATARYRELSDICHELDVFETQALFLLIDAPPNAYHAWCVELYELIGEQLKEGYEWLSTALQELKR